MAFSHTPYDGSKRPFSIGLEPLDLKFWLEADANRPRDLKEKAALIAADRDVVFQAEAASLDAQHEAAALVRAWVHAEGLPVVPAPVTDDEPLLAASRQVQEDLILMQRDETGWRLTAASLCFPSTWSLREKFGLTLDTIHGAVPGFPGRMEQIVSRIFDNLKVEQPVWRLNWSIYGDARLHHPESKSDPHERFPPDIPVKDRAVIRVERQTLRKLRETGAVLFTIRIHTDAMVALQRHVRGPDLAQSLRQQLLGLDQAQLDYKGLVQSRDRLALALAEIGQV